MSGAFLPPPQNSSRTPYRAEAAKGGERDSTKPVASVKVHVRTIAHDLERYAESIVEH